MVWMEPKRAPDRSVLCSVGLGQSFARPKSRIFNDGAALRVFGDNGVRGLEVSVEKAAGMRGGKPFEALAGDSEEVVVTEGGFEEDFVEGAAGDVFHDEPGLISVEKAVVNGDDVGVLVGSEGAGFAEDLLGGGDGGSDVGSEAFESDPTVECSIVGEINFTETTAVKLAVEDVAMNEISGLLGLHTAMG